MNSCKDCDICKERLPNLEGVKITELELIPFFKNQILNLKYPTHPFPLRHKNLLPSLMALGQVLAHHRLHNLSLSAAVYYTENSSMLTHAAKIEDKFGIKVRAKSEAPKNTLLVCEFNIDIRAVR